MMRSSTPGFRNMDTEHAQELRMEKKEPSDATTRKRVKQSISIPFIWEEFPGIPKKNWKPTAPPKKLEAPPAKYVASVPFKWEEKPGTPLPSFSQQPPPGSTLVPAGEKVNSFPLSPRYDRGHLNNWSCLNDQDGDEIDMQDSYPETCESETDDSFTSAAPSLLLVPTMAISNAVPVQQISVTSFNGEQLQSPASPASETDSSTSSYETGVTGLAGSSFLEWLFPLLTPQSNSQEKVGRSEMCDSRLKTRKHGNDFLCEKNYGASITKPQTLGELILMSRRFSYQRKAVQMRTQNPPKKLVKRNGLGHCILETSNILSRFHKKWTRQLQLKLM